MGSGEMDWNGGAGRSRIRGNKDSLRSWLCKCLCFVPPSLWPVLWSCWCPVCLEWAERNWLCEGKIWVSVSPCLTWVDYVFIRLWNSIDTDFQETVSPVTFIPVFCYSAFYYLQQLKHQASRFLCFSSFNLFSYFYHVCLLF